MSDSLNYYIYHLSHLHTARYKGKAAPHKAVLLLAVMELIEQGVITSNEIELTDSLVDKFNDIWHRYRGATSIFTPDIGKPYYHMQHEPFWHLVEEGDENYMLAESLGLPHVAKKLPARSSYSVKTLRSAFCYAALSQDLFEHMKTAEARDKLKVVLINNYLVSKEPNGTSFAAMGLAAQLLYLIAS